MNAINKITQHTPGVGRLTPLQSGYWGIVYMEERPDDEIHSGDCIYLEVENALVLTRIEYDHRKKQFYSVDGHPMKVGGRASLSEHGSLI